MDFVSQLQWQQPAWLLLILILLALYFFYIKNKKESRINAFIPQHLLHYVVTSEGKKQKQQTGLFFTAGILICIAAAGPFFSQASTDSHHYPGANVAIILDISPSMAVADISPNRLQQSKIQLKQFIRTLKRTRLALIIFSANAYTVLPLTQDKQSVIHFIDAMRPDLVSIPGSNLSLAITRAKDALNIMPIGEDKPSKGLVILVSDGEIHDSGAWQATQNLTQQGHTLFTIGVGTEAGGPVPLPNGQLVRQNGELITSQRQRQTLLNLAKQGGGDYFDLSPQAWETLELKIEQLERTHFENDINEHSKILLFPWFIAAAFSLILVQTIRRPDAVISIAFALGILSFSATSEASPWQESAALAALEKGDNLTALALYQEINNANGLVGQGVSLYRLQQWDNALKAFQTALSLANTTQQISQANYNLGNTLIHKKEFDRAKEAFQRTLIATPSHKHALFNLALLNEHIKKTGEKTTNKNKPPIKDTSLETVTLNPDETGIDQQLRLWDQLNEYKKTEQIQPLQQLQTLKEDSETMLKRRFAIIDKNTVGLAEEKSW